MATNSLGVQDEPVLDFPATNSLGVQDEPLLDFPAAKSLGVQDDLLLDFPNSRSLAVQFDLEVFFLMPGLIKGKQLIDSAVYTAKIAADALAASAAGRAKMQDGFFDSATVTSKFAAASISDSRLVELYIKANGTRAFTADQPMGGFKLTGLGDPTTAQDAATKFYVDAVASGLDVKASARVATTAVLPAVTASGTGVGKTLTANAVGVLTVDSVATVLNDRILVKNQVAGADNGLYKVTTEGTAGVAFVLTRAIDADQNAEVTAGMFTFVTEGTANADTGWVLSTNDPITVDTTSLSFVQFSSAGVITAGAGLLQTGSVFDVVIASGSGGLTANANDISVNYATTAQLADADAAAEAAGTSETLARGDHKHLVSTGSPTVTVKSEATAAATGTAATLLRTDAQIQVATATPGTTIKSDATAASQGTSSSLLRADAQLVALTAAPTDVGTANAAGASSSLARADHVHKAFGATTSNKNMTASVTTADNQEATATTIAATPALDGYVQVFVNGVKVQVGDGTKVSVVSYFSGDAGATARSITAIVSGDKLFWNGSIAGYELDATDKIDFDYEA
jgi:hypothetical protein